MEPVKSPLSWARDLLGPDFQAALLQVPASNNSQSPSRLATLVRHMPPKAPAPQRAVLFLHGWSDYFFNTELATFFTQRGIAFYALDMHNHGRSLRHGDVGGFVGNLEDYDAEIGLALEYLRADLAQRRGAWPASNIILMGHSTGGLIASLWAASHPESVSHLILNSPWLEMHVNRLVRHASVSLTAPMAKWWPKLRVRLPERNFYWRSISRAEGGEWDLDESLRPPAAFPVRFGWMNAILAGQAQVARGLDIHIPILVLMSTRSLNGPRWREDMRRADAVLDIQTMAARALTLGQSVSIERIEGGLHDVLLSAKPVRQDAYCRLGRWLDGYAPALSPSSLTAEDYGPLDISDQRRAQ